jgi:hypothetical protein
VRHALHGSGAGADDADALVGEFFHQRAEWIAAGVIVIPAAGVERVSLEGLDAFDAGKFRHMQRPRAHADELRGEGVAAVGADIPARLCFVPIEAHDLGVKQRVVVEAVLLADTLAVREDFRRMRILLRGHMAGFFEQRHVDHRRGIALRARIPVPVPGAAEVATLLYDADIPDAGFGQARGGGEPGKAAADEGEADVVDFRIARGDRRIGVVEIMRELSCDTEILVVTIRAEPLVALLQISLTQPLLVDRWVLRGLGLFGHCHPARLSENCERACH